MTNERQQRMQDMLTAIADQMGAHKLNWLETIYVFGVVTRALIDEAPSSIVHAESLARMAYDSGLGEAVDKPRGN